LIPHFDKLCIQIIENFDRQILLHHLFNIVSQNRHPYKTNLKSRIPKHTVDKANYLQLELESDQNSNNELNIKTDSLEDKHIYKCDLSYKNVIQIIKYASKLCEKN
jgi:hypothetical protein